MRELLRSNDLVRISWIQALLSDGGIEIIVLDTHMSVLEGSLGILPRRVMVSVDDLSRARWILRESGEDHDLSDEQSV